MSKPIDQQPEPSQAAYLCLKSGADKRLKQGHVWIYSNEIDTQKSPLKLFEAGQQVQVLNASGKAIATAMVSPKALIAARLLSRDANQFMDRSLLVHRFKIALSLRERAFGEPYYRMVYGDSDALPGLVIDRFGDVFVVQISSAGMEVLKDEIVAALEKVCSPSAILFKNDGKMRASEGLESYVEFAKGEQAEASLIENGVNFIAPIVEGQKTGWFYDHRMNRARLAPYVQGKRVLDLFSYVGGWGVQAAAFGAESVLCVDSSATALDYVERNAALNGVEAKVSTLQGDVFDACAQLKAEGERFDVVIADPPAFIPRRKDQKVGQRAYQKLNQIAMRLLSKDGLLVSGSCSMHLSREALTDTIRACGRTLEKDVQMIEQGAQGADHPILPAIPETEYLKAAFVRVLPYR